MSVQVFTRFIGPNPTADLAIFTQDLKVLLIKRNQQSSACAGMWALPGGFVDSKVPGGRGAVFEPAESIEAAALRELKEETGLSINVPQADLIQVGVYEKGGRDPRDTEQSWSQSHLFAYFLLKDAREMEGLTTASDETDDVQWVLLEKALQMNLAFDHGKMLEDCQKTLGLAREPAGQFQGNTTHPKA